jgi:hypothetical protein
MLREQRVFKVIEGDEAILSLKSDFSQEIILLWGGFLRTGPSIP